MDSLFPYQQYREQNRVMAMFPKEPGFYIKNINIGSIRVVEKKPMKVTRYKYIHRDLI